ncbi:MAG: response regulator [Planctomycetota bacterium]|jgi:two-component system nitrogen regulation response regulator GlnG|nr:response regulator [Planctomycetota bacterium]
MTHTPNTSEHRLLIADDDVFIRDFLSRSLGRAGWCVECVASGEEAIERLRKDPYAALICDLHMEGMSGRQTIQKVQEIAPDMPIMVMTGDETLDTERTIRHLQVFYYFVKPLEIAEVEQVLSSALGLVS